MRRLGTVVPTIDLLAILAQAIAPSARAQDATTGGISDITAILDQQKPDRARLARNRAAADEAPPADGQLGQFYYRRAQARAALGRAEDAIADCKEAIAQGGDLQTEIARYTQLLTQQYRILGRFRAAIEVDQAMASQIEAAERGKGLLFGIYLRIITSSLNVGDV
jgi:hypothetical protein